MVRLTPLNGTVPFSDNTTLGQKLETLRKLTSDKVTNPALLLNIHSLLPRAKAVAEERNRYIHDQWEFNPELVAKGRIRRLRFFYSPIIKTERQEFTMDNLVGFLNEIGKLQNSFHDFLKVLISTNRDAI